MRRRTFLAATAVGASLALSARPAAARASAEAGRTVRHVVLVDWDGVDPSYLDRHAASLPNLHALAASGTRTVAGCTYKAVSNPNRASLATGALPATHGNTAYVLDPATGRARGQTRVLAVENMVQSLRRQGRTVVSAGWYIVQDRGVSYGDPDGLYTQGSTWEENVDTAVRVLRGEPVDSGGEPVTVARVPDLLALYSADIDSIGHGEGPGSERIPARLAEMDTGLGRLVETLRETGLYERTVMVFVSDHGMTGYTESLEPQVLGALRDAGFGAERLYSGRAPGPDTEVVLTASPRTANVYLRGAAAEPEGRARVESLLRGLPELEAVRDRGELDALGASPEEGDLTIEARPPYAFVDPAIIDGRERGGHSSMREARAPLILSGPGIAVGAVPADARVIDVAPTISRLLGAEPPAGAQGRVLEEAFTDG
ncbi:alkaline phosphatase family protein [Marinactinospora thermotolerans]|uniref:Predicted pyrophosphatase or phosphodiesterase, AlkP superfamily n=1 Tax=Marinactinospora thermotolerans DSM 45154 TaxID=1122192 RepID=A0A1T4LVE9_9ACTN|nr:alkaline phosphatase family protein [Marinactinospora thermotolerans]SJZ58703.1 Predicted pyrophosphatase or phosphodiesterase, AlkP superfamily [Marinactinospora thermotolerans DSM 45154]